MNTFLHVLCGKQLTRLRSADPRCPPACLTQGPNCLWAAPFVPAGPNVSTRVVPKNCADLETCELVDTSCVGAKRRWNAPFIFSLGEQAEQMMKLSQDDTCATVYATFSRRKKPLKNLTSGSVAQRSHTLGGWFTCLVKIPGTINLFFFFLFFFWW